MATLPPLQLGADGLARPVESASPTVSKPPLVAGPGGIADFANPVDRIRSSTPEQLAADEKFDPVQFAADHYDVLQDNEITGKLAQVAKARRMAGFDVGDFAVGAWRGAKGAVTGAALGAVQVAKTTPALVKGLPATLAAEAGRVSTGKAGLTGEEALTPDEVKFQKAMMEVSSAGESSFASMGEEARKLGRWIKEKWAWAGLGGKPVDEYTDQDWANRFRTDAEMRRRLNETVQGRGLGKDTAEYAKYAEALKKQGVEVDPTNVQHLQGISDLIAYYGVFKGAGMAGQKAKAALGIAPKAAAPLSVTAAEKAIETAGKGAELAGKATAATGEAIQAAAAKVPFGAASVVPRAIGGYLGMGPIGAAAAAWGPTAVKYLGKGAEAVGRGIQAAAPAVARSGAVQGTIHSIPVAAAFAVAQDTSEQAGEAFGGAAAFGAMFGGAADVKRGVTRAGQALGGRVAKDVFSSVVDRQTYSPNYSEAEGKSATWGETAETPGTTFDLADLNAKHDANVRANKLAPSRLNWLNTFREMFRPGARIYVLDGAQFKQQTGTDNAGAHYGDAKLDNGQTADIILVNADAKLDSVAHEPGHMLLYAAGKAAPEAQAAFWKTIENTFGAEGIEQYRQAYSQAIGREVSTVEAMHEMGAELVAKELYGGRFDGAPRGFADGLKRWVGRALEVTGLYGPQAQVAVGTEARTGATPFGIQPGFEVGRAAERVATEAMPPGAVEAVRVQQQPGVAELPVEPLPAKAPGGPPAPPGAPPVPPPPPGPPGPAPAGPAPAPPPGVPPVPPPPAEKPPLVVGPDGTARPAVAPVAPGRVTPDRPGLRRPRTAAEEEAATAAKEWAAVNRPDLLRTIEELDAIINENGVFEALYASVKGVKREQGRVARRQQQEAAYTFEDAAEWMKEAQRILAGMPSPTRALFEKKFVPVRWAVQTREGTPVGVNLRAYSLDKAVVNMERYAKWVSQNVPSESRHLYFPDYALDAQGNLTADAWAKFYRDLTSYTENQSNGWKGDGSAPLEAPAGTMVEIPRATPGWDPARMGTLLDERTGNVMNLIQGGFGTTMQPLTGRVSAPREAIMGEKKWLVEAKRKDPTTGAPAIVELPANIRVRPLAKAGGRPATVVSPFRGKTGAKQFELASGNLPIVELNPLRYKLAMDFGTGKAMDLLNNFHAVTENLNIEGLANVKKTGAQMAPGVTDITRAGFQPAARAGQESAGGYKMPETAKRRTVVSNTGKLVESRNYEFFDAGGPGNRSIWVTDPTKGNRAVGHIFTTQDGPTANVDMIQVMPTYRGEHLGEALMREAVNQVQADGATAITGMIVHPAPIAMREKVFGPGTTEYAVGGAPATAAEATAGVKALREGRGVTISPVDAISPIERGRVYQPSERAQKMSQDAVAATGKDWLTLMDPQKQWAEGKGLTGYAYEMGLAARTPEDLALLRDQRDQFRQQFRMLKEQKDLNFDALNEAATKSQLFSEAEQAATGTGSAAHLADRAPLAGAAQAPERVGPQVLPMQERMQLPDRSTVRGGEVSRPVATYTEAAVDSSMQENPWVRRSDAPDNTGRQLLVQFSTHLLNADAKAADQASLYYDKLYSGARTGYDRLHDFWEIPQWMGFASKIFPNADVYVVRDMAKAKEFLNSASYDRVAFSALDVNKHLIRELAESYKGQIDVGGYVQPSELKGLDNVTWHDSMADWAKAAGVPYVDGVDYRHFQGSDVIPRLTMSQGCKHKCAFCTVEKTLKETPQPVIEQQADEIARLGAKLVYLNDKTFGQAKNYRTLPDLYARMREINPEFKGFIVQTTASQMTKFDPAWLKASGIKFVELGIETYNDPILKEMRKPATESLMDRSTAALREVGITLIPNIIIGLPGETAQTYARTLDFLKKNKDIISHANIYNLAVYREADLGKKLTTAAETDFNENVLEKSWHIDPEVHRVFAGDLYGLANEMLSTRPTTLDFQPGERAKPPENVQPIEEMQTLWSTGVQREQEIKRRGQPGPPVEKTAEERLGIPPGEVPARGGFARQQLLRRPPQGGTYQAGDRKEMLKAAEAVKPGGFESALDIVLNDPITLESDVSKIGQTVRVHRTGGRVIDTMTPTQKINLVKEVAGSLERREYDKIIGPDQELAAYLLTDVALTEPTPAEKAIAAKSIAEAEITRVGLTEAREDFAKAAEIAATAEAKALKILEEAQQRAGTSIRLPSREQLKSAEPAFSAPERPDVEHIVGAAIRMRDTGDVYSGPIHMYAWVDAVDKGALKKYGYDNYDALLEAQNNPQAATVKPMDLARANRWMFNPTVADRGFLTSKGRFLMGEEATQVAERAKQLVSEPSIVNYPGERDMDSYDIEMRDKEGNIVDESGQRKLNAFGQPIGGGQAQPAERRRRGVKPIAGLTTRSLPVDRAVFGPGADYWMDPNGFLYPLERGQTHAEWVVANQEKLGLRKLIDESSDALLERFDAKNLESLISTDEAHDLLVSEGWVRIASDRDRIYATRETDAGEDIGPDMAHEFALFEIANKTGKPIYNSNEQLLVEAPGAAGAGAAQPAERKDWKMPRGQSGGFKKAWILPDGTPVQLGGIWHHQWLDQNKDLVKRFGLAVPKFTGQDAEGVREAALKKGFVRINYGVNDGTVTIELRKKDLERQRGPLWDFAERNIDDIDNARVTLLDDAAAKVVDSKMARLFNYDTAQEKLDNFPFLGEEQMTGSYQAPERPATEDRLVETLDKLSEALKALAPATAKRGDLDKAVSDIVEGRESGYTLNADMTVFAPKTPPAADSVTLASVNIPLEKLTPDAVLEALKPFEKVLKVEGIKPGLFKLANGQEVSVDVNVLVPNQFRENSMKFARDNQQQAIWDYAKGELVETGGTGETVIKDVDVLPAVAAKLVKGEPVDVSKPAELKQGEFFPAPPPKDKAKALEEQNAELARVNPELLTLDLQYDKKGRLQVDPKGAPIYKGVPYEFEKAPLVKDLDTKAAINKYAEELLKELAEALKDPAIADGKQWYERFRRLLREKIPNEQDQFLFAQLLAATSPNNAAYVNWINAVEAFNRHKQGQFDPLIKTYLAGKDLLARGELADMYAEEKGITKSPKTGTYRVTDVLPYKLMNWWINKNNLVPLKRTGKMFGMNSVAVMEVLAGDWVGAQKTQNFALNMTGLGFRATIDIWASRLLRRLGYEPAGGRWRIHTQAEKAPDKRDFDFAQDVFDAATELANKRNIGGTDWKPDGLQSILWFVEKRLWDQRGWTREAGSELADFGKYLELYSQEPSKGVLFKTEEGPSSEFAVPPSVMKAELRGFGQKRLERLRTSIQEVKPQKGVMDPRVAAALERVQISPIDYKRFATQKPKQ